MAPHGAPIPYQRVGLLFLVAALILLALGLAGGTPFFADRGGSPARQHAAGPLANQHAASAAPAQPAGAAPPAQRPVRPAAALRAVEPAAARHAVPPGAAQHQVAPAGAESHGPAGERHAATFVPPIVWVVPFAAVLLVVAVFPLVPVLAAFWDSNANKLLVSAVLGLPVAFYVWQNDPTQVLHTGLEYFQFIALLAALFIVAGGLHLTGNLEASPRVNTGFLAIGYVLASLIGTTGAAMVLIYPLLRTNSERRHKAHTVIFFIFLVCNVGGLLTPIGDPPLFLGYLRGIDFFWFLNLTPLWVFLGIILLAFYYGLDRHFYRRETKKAIALDARHEEPVHLIGVLNIALLVAVVGSVAASVATPYREAIMTAAAGASLVYAHRSRRARRARDGNHFNFHAIQEVAAVFAGIFAAMMPALILLNKRGAALGVDQPLEFFYATGLFSSFLDNAPTFLVFLELALGVTGIPTASGLQAGQAAVILGAISAGAVFMGAITYIGNAPNFMVRSIAEQRHVKMPSFFGFMGWSTLILLPAFTAAAIVFFVLLPFPLW
ncbi:MAG TPA: sodium:proton antiporter [Vicinamibacterales bacterium]|nr:sodium:proton antiporter [Vicinamibacterales bacterium]